MRFPWSFAQISTLPFLQTPTQLYVVPRSMPMQGPSIGSSDAPPRRRRTGAAVRRPRGVSRAAVVARSALKSALLLRRTMVSYVHVCARVRSLQLLCSRVCCRSDDSFLREALLVPVLGYGTCILQSFAAIAQHYAIDQASPISKCHLVPLSGGMLAWLIRTTEYSSSCCKSFLTLPFAC